MDSESLNNRIREALLECRICLSSLTKPKTLPQCLHTFCEKCLMNYIMHQLEPFQDEIMFPCPICRSEVDLGNIATESNEIDDSDEHDERIQMIRELQVTERVSGLPNAFFAVSLADIIQEDDTHRQRRGIKDRACGVCKYRDNVSEEIQSVATCVECKLKLCRQCCATHCELEVTRHHTLLYERSSNVSTSQMTNDDSHSDWSDILDCSLDSSSDLNSAFQFCNLCESETFAITECAECEIRMCGTCSLIHTESFSSNDHSLSRIVNSKHHKKRETKEINEIEMNNECAMHSGEMKAYYCSSCENMICIACLLTSHTNHDTMTLGKAFNTLDLKLQPVVNEANRVLFKISEENEHLMAIEQQLTLERKSITSCIQRQYLAQMELLHGQRDALLARVNSFYDTDELTRRQSRVDSHMEALLEAGGDLLNETMCTGTKRTVQDLENGMKVIRGLEGALGEVQIMNVLEIGRKLDSKLYFTPVPLLSLEGVGALYVTCSTDHNISPLASISNTRVYSSPYRNICSRQQVLSVCLLADKHDLVLLVNPEREGQPCIRLYGSTGVLRAQYGSGIRHPVACAMRREDGLLAVLTADRVYNVNTSTGISQHFATRGGCHIAVDSTDRVLVLDTEAKVVHVHSHCDGHFISSLSVSEATRPLAIDVCSTRVCVLDNQTNTIIYKYTDAGLEFVARMNADLGILSRGISVVVSEQSNGLQYLADEQKMLSLSLDGRIRRVTGVVSGIQHVAINKHQLVVSKRVLTTGRVKEDKVDTPNTDVKWTIHRYCIMHE